MGVSGEMAHWYTQKWVVTVVLAGTAGTGVASSSGHGDGIYQVWAELADGRVARLVIEFC